MRFTATLLLGKKTATGIEIPAEIIEALGGGKRPAVVATVNSYVYRTTVGVMSGRYLLPFSADHRAASGLAAGDAVLVDLALDTEPRDTLVPEDLVEALDGSPSARGEFDALAPSRRKAIVTALEGAKSPETRARRLSKVISDLETTE